jgi:hypothetical protein
MALNKLVYEDIPHVPKRGVKRIPEPYWPSITAGTIGGTAK